MKKKVFFKYILSLLIISYLLNDIKVYSQDCGTTSSSVCNSQNFRNIPVNTPGSADYLRCLIIYVTFPDDADTGYAYTIWDRPQPPIVLNTKPINPYSGTNGHLIDSLVGNNSTPFMTRYHNYTLSDFFCEMSLGEYDVIGDEISITLPKSSLYYKDTLHLTEGWGFMSRYILKYIDSTRDIDWSRYDNWSSDNGWEFEPDGTAEMILMNYRNVPNNNGWFCSPGTGGVATLKLDSSITFGNTTIGCDNGIIAINFGHATGQSLAILEHEFSHKLFGASFINSNDNGLHLNIGFMTKTTSNTSYIMTPMERSASAVTYISVNLINSTGIYTDTLPDFTESGVTYKIKIPSTTSDYFWIANHQKKSLYDGIARGGKNCYEINFAEIDPFCSDGKGLFVYHEGVSCYENINSPYDVISAEGKFIWGSDRSVHVPRQNYYFPMNDEFTIFKITSASRYHGRDEYRKSVNFTEQFLADDICSNDTDDYFVAWENRGDDFDAFNIGYDEIFSPYSNPSSSSCDSGNIGLTFALMEQNSTTGAIVVKIYYNNNAQALIDLPPSKPKNLRVVKDFFGADTGVFGGGDPGTFHPKITWDRYIEPDFYTNSYLSNPSEVQPVYEIYRGYSADCNVQPEYTLVASLPHTDTLYVDSSVTLYDPDHTTVAHCASDFLTYSYKILAKDTRGYRSLKSERGIVSGYSMDCSPEDDNQVSNNGNQNLNNPTAEFSLKQNYPNPFNPSTHLEFGISDLGFVSLKVYDITGKELKTLVNEIKPAGNYSIEFNGSNLPSGVYYYKIESGNFMQVRKMILLK